MTTQQQARWRAEKKGRYWWLVKGDPMQGGFVLRMTTEDTIGARSVCEEHATYLNALEDVAEVLPDVRDVLLMDRNSIDAVQSAVKRAEAALARLEEARRG